MRSIALLAAVVGSANAFVSPAGNTVSRDTSLNVETIRKKEFVAAMAEELGYTKTDAEAALMVTLNMISDVSLAWFCSLLATIWNLATQDFFCDGWVDVDLAISQWSCR